MKNPAKPAVPADPAQRIGPRPFGVVVTELADGDLERRLTAEFADVVRAVEDTGKPGKLTLNILVGTDGKMIRVVADTKVTIPKPPVEGTAFFSDDRGGLHRENPRQAKLWPSGAVRDGERVDYGERPARASVDLDVPPKSPWPYNRPTATPVVTDDDGGEE